MHILLTIFGRNFKGAFNNTAEKTMRGLQGCVELFPEIEHRLTARRISLQDYIDIDFHQIP